MFLKLGWPKVLTFHFLCDTQTQNIKRFFFLQFCKKKKIQVHFDTYLCIPSREIKICHFVFLFYQYSPFLFPQKVNLKKKKKAHTLLFVSPNLLSPLSQHHHQQQSKNTQHSSQRVKIKNQKPLQLLLGFHKSTKLNFPFPKHTHTHIKIEN